eukprot:Filipodium_phascolosomae@DN2483_c0_g1_i1.p1
MCTLGTSRESTQLLCDYALYFRLNHSSYITSDKLTKEAVEQHIELFTQKGSEEPSGSIQCEDCIEAGHICEVGNWVKQTLFPQFLQDQVWQQKVAQMIGLGQL